jgi:hypothetical protein
MAFLGCDPSKTRATRNDFIEWVDTYLLPNSELKCTAIDLYAARCGVVHSYSASSDLSESGRARTINYAYGNKTQEELQIRLDKSSSARTTVAVHVDKLFQALRAGVERFKNALEKDPSKASVVARRAEETFLRVVGL